MSAVSSELFEMGNRMREQDNRATAHPIFLVEQRRRIFGIVDGYTEAFAWLHDEDERRAVESSLAASLEAGHCAGLDAPDGFIRLGYVDIWEFATCCFTEKGAEDYIRLNGHNLKEPRTYVASAYRNSEWQAVRAFLLGLVKEEA